MHTRIAKNVNCGEKPADLDSLWYVCETIVLLMQVEYKVKYNVDFWKDFNYQTLDAEAIEYLLQSELRSFNREWNLSIAKFKPIMRALINV